MKALERTAWLALAITLLIATNAVRNVHAADVPITKKNPKLYDTAADGNQQIAAALKEAKADRKRVLLKFGANW